MSLKRALCLASLLMLGADAIAQPGSPQWTAEAIAPAQAYDTERLRFLGGLHLRADDPRFGGLSGLRWRDGALMAVSDEGHWLEIVLDERDERMIGVRSLKIGALHGLDGKALKSKAAGDAEALSVAANGDWLVAFEQDHRIWRYPAINGPAQPVGIEPEAILGSLAPNNGVEAMAGTEADLTVCPEAIDWIFVACRLVESGRARGLHIAPPAPLNELGGVPTDADRRHDGTTFVLFRSYSRAAGVHAAIVEIAPDVSLRTLAVFGPKDGIDNMEGLALREADGRTFLYVVSDDNFSSQQRTLLLKFELLPSL